MSQPEAFSSGGILVGRRVANVSFLSALMDYAGSIRLCFVVGERSEVRNIQAMSEGIPSGIEVTTCNLLDLPHVMAQGQLDVLHFTDVTERMATTIQLRNRYARAPLPITGQIHSLSYPVSMRTYLHLFLANPRAEDGIFCSTVAGRDVVKHCTADVVDRISRRGVENQPLPWSLPVVPLGIDVGSLQTGDGAAMRRELRIEERAFVFLTIGRFTEYDKMDLYPVVQAFASFLEGRPANAEPCYLVLAGASQGTETARMVQIWARMLQVDQWLVLRVDFPDEEKASLLAAADVFVSMTDNPQETYGLSVVEAMAAGLPVIVSDFNGYKDTVTDEVGIRVTTRWNVDMEYLSDVAPLLYERPLHLFLGQGVEVDLVELEQAFRKMCNEPQTRRAMSMAAKQRAEQLYDWSAVIPQYFAAWETLRNKTSQSGPEQLDIHRLSYRASFSHYPTEWSNPGRMLVRSSLAVKMCGSQNHHPIYVEMKVVFDSEDVLDAVKLAAEPLKRGDLEHAISQRRLGGMPWRANLLVAWMIKHGLLIDAVPSSLG